MGITARAGGGVGWASAPFTVLGEQGPRGSHRVLASRGGEEQMPEGTWGHSEEPLTAQWGRRLTGGLEKQSPSCLDQRAVWTY